MKDSLSSHRDSSEIGSYFSINPNYEITTIVNDTKESIFGENVAFFSTCRSAIKEILLSLNDERRIAILPAFTCHAVVEPFEKAGYQVFPYPVSKDLKVDPSQFWKTAKDVNPSVILIHDYFGFDSNHQLIESDVIAKCKANNITIIEDKTQSMFSSYKHLEADYYVGSIRKWMGIPDGAFAIGEGISQPKKEDVELTEAKHCAMVYKHNYLYAGIGEKHNVLPLYRKAEDILDSRQEAFAISKLSEKLLSAYDIKAFCRIRRDNCQRLIDGLKRFDFVEIPFECVSTEETPFYLPVFIRRNRKELQRYLANNGVYATIIWGCPESIIEKIDSNANRIYEEILCIPCDQRYSLNDMDYICALFTNYNE